MLRGAELDQPLCAGSEGKQPDNSGLKLILRSPARAPRGSKLKIPPFYRTNPLQPRQFVRYSFTDTCPFSGRKSGHFGRPAEVLR